MSQLLWESVSEATWDKVQDTLASRGRAGEKHHHYLKGTVFAGDCGSRLLVSNSRGRRGKVYPYFICPGRQQKRTECSQRATLIETIEEQVETYYATIQPTAELLDQLRNLILDEIQLQRVSAEQEQ